MEMHARKKSPINAGAVRGAAPQVRRTLALVIRTAAVTAAVFAALFMLVRLILPCIDIGPLFPGRVWRNSVGMEFMAVQGGSFRLGMTPGEADEHWPEYAGVEWFERYRTELTPHDVEVSGFWIGKTEVTQAQYLEITGEDPSEFIPEADVELPVESLNWFDAVVFCNLLSIREQRTPVYRVFGSVDPADWPAIWREGRLVDERVEANFSANGYRLPTEAEWVFAARGGVRSAVFRYSGSENPDAVAWFINNSRWTSHPVGTKAPNRLGILDMSGNVQEWCWDWYGPYPAEPAVDPRGPASGSFRILRGGSLFSSRALLSVEYRDIQGPAYRTFYIGFRVVRSAE